MRFQITKIVGFVGFVSFVLWSGLLRLEPIRYRCEVNYYGVPNMSNLANDIIEYQISSYDTDYNYHRSIGYVKDDYNDRFCDLIENIEYYGHNIFNGDATIEDIKYKIEKELYEEYDNYGYNSYDLILSWNKTNMFCQTIFNVSNNLNLKAGDIITCYENGFYYGNGFDNNIFGCNVELKEMYSYDRYILFFTCLTIICLSLVVIVTILAMIARYCNNKRSFGKDFGFKSENIEVRSVSPSTSSESK